MGRPTLDGSIRAMAAKNETSMLRGSLSWNTRHWVGRNKRRLLLVSFRLATVRCTVRLVGRMADGKKLKKKIPKAQDLNYY